VGMGGGGCRLLFANLLEDLEVKLIIGLGS
jgi:hypothetical protein